VHFFIKVFKELKWIFNHNINRCLQHSILSQNEKIATIENQGGLNVLKQMDKTYNIFIFMQFTPYI
jgi:hypothetical protein